MSDDNPVLAAALAYAARGWRVFPCDPHPEKPRAKQPLVKADVGPDGKSVPGSGWPAKASSDPTRIRAWWSKWPDALIGCSPGGMGAFVVDLDPKGESVEVVEARLIEAVGALPRVARTVTQSGGRHLWFRHPDGEWGNATPGLKNIDIRCDAGYVILPPSTLRNGNAYAWEGEPFDPASAPSVPDALLALIRGRREKGAGESLAGGLSQPSAPPRPRDASPGETAKRRYALAALDAIGAEAASAPPGGRGTALFAAACAAGRFVATGALSEREAFAALADAADTCGLTKDDGAARVEREIRRGLSEGRASAGEIVERLATIAREAEEKAARRGRREVAAMPDDGRWAPPPELDDYGQNSPAPSTSGDTSSSQTGAAGAAAPGGAGGGVADDLELGFKPLTDLGNAERFAARYRGKLIFVEAMGWLVWTGHRWAREGANEAVTRAVHDVVRRIQDEATAVRRSDRDHTVGDGKKAKLYSDKVAEWGRASEAAAKLKPIPLQAAPYLAVASSDLDADPWKINVLNGTLVIRRKRGEGDPIRLKPHDPGDFITKLAPVIYDPNAVCPTYDTFLAEVQPAAPMRRFMHQWGGYSLTGDVGEQKLCFFYGKGKNGKSTLVDAWGAVAGDYGETVPIETFLDQGRGRNAGAATPDLAILPGVRFLRTSEPEKGAKLAEALIKLVTGGEPIQARHLNRDYFKFRPAFKLTMSGNYRPSIDGTDEGIWRRLVLVPWLVTVAIPDRLLPFKLAAEASGILNRLLDGLRDYLDAGMVWPEAVTEATEQYREDSDPLGRFLADAVATSPGNRVQVTELHRVHSAWAKANGEKEWSAKGLSAAMKERGYRSKQSNVMWWLDITMLKGELDYDTGDQRWPP